MRVAFGGRPAGPCRGARDGDSKMNTVGKILVILNFVFAVVVGAFLVVDFATRTNWQNEYKNLKAQQEVVVIDREIHMTENAKHRSNLADLDMKLATQVQKLKDQEDVAKVTEGNLIIKLDEQERKAKDADSLRAKAISDLEALKVVEVDLKTIVKKREQAIIELQDTVKQFRTEALDKTALADALQGRNDQRLKEVQDLRQKLYLALARPGTGC